MGMTDANPLSVVAGRPGDLDVPVLPLMVGRKPRRFASLGPSTSLSPCAGVEPWPCALPAYKNRRIPTEHLGTHLRIAIIDPADRMAQPRRMGKATRRGPAADSAEVLALPSR